MSLDNLKRSLIASPIVKMGDYDYFVNPITDGVPRVEPSVLSEVLDDLEEAGDFDCDLIIAPESMGIPIAVPLSLELEIPYSIIRKKQYGLPGEMALDQSTGYSKSKLYMNGISKGDRVTIVDSVISTGGTMEAVIRGIRDAGASIVDILVVVEKGNGKRRIESELGIKIKSLVRVEISGKSVRVLD